MIMSLLIKTNAIYEKLKAGDLAGGTALVESMLADLLLNEEACDFYDLMVAMKTRIDAIHSEVKALEAR
jgi:hypothetical protein